MIREGRFKYVIGEGTPAQLFDLEADPLELNNLAQDPAHRETAARFQAAVDARWDQAKLKQEVLLSQRRRHRTFAALAKGRHQPWDYQPYEDASKRYARNVGVDLLDLEKTSRFPVYGGR